MVRLVSPRSVDREVNGPHFGAYRQCRCAAVGPVSD
jgi:hypothetical protein